MGAVMVFTTTITVSKFSSRANTLISTHSQERIEAIEKSFTFSAEYGLIVKDDEVLSKLARSVEEQKDIAGAFILDLDGRIASGVSSRLSPDQSAQIVNSVMTRLKKLGSPRLLYGVSAGSQPLNVLVEGVYTQKKQSAEELGLFQSAGDAPKELIGYSVIVSSPKRIHAEIEDARNSILITNATLTAIVLAFLFIITALLVNALGRLNAAMKKVGRGEISTRVSIRSRDELEELGEGFNSMAEDLQKTTVSRDALMREIEERKRLENIVLQTEKMAAVGQLAGGVAHEINNPLGVILGFSQSMVKRLHAGDPYEVPLRAIEREAIRCKNLVQDLLMFSRANKSSEKSDIDVGEAIESSLSLIMAHSTMKNIVVERETAPNLPKVHANTNQIQQVIVNLCNNAIDAMGEGGKVTLRTRSVMMNEKNFVQIQVQDTGHGIPKEIQDRVFEPFFTTKEVGKGTGLGLSLVYEIIQKHDGQILLQSEMGKGTIFTVVLPAIAGERDVR